ncbi:Ppx/GppA phosphatase family protein [Citromicrobium bathyomarinum]|jgi:exopolyphosphatase / guanosine-5'-triphosphate,3'-diphosphate pyrophosphatase|uniref:Ppx/GppA phosphatase family protein n=1 Tax=Sphingomonadales TaxID=204457 RepID=UPI0001DD0505|nr:MULTISPECIES: Ppx/GppA phosphatase family protein [Sphingomonadales]MEC8179087.1 Ppx/GppA phosphatase family protein [Pseudomonadota bacterium]ALG60089.1 exopolyphosphatase [Citromicrobium sp. JL477]KPM17530.1 exopolyphosphatase [Citromicrobium sp. JL31]KPM18757.1 exopolyphosphatase [Citromicrobium sp. JL1351]KPM22054.1 exopolyphosphatase [Citromicrobium sp. RCC1885]|tara:strand:+ start:232 stop:1428 length:1197 start_codon:yes stop_codon:yes gene_type:complete
MADFAPPDDSKGAYPTEGKMSGEVAEKRYHQPPKPTNSPKRHRKSDGRRRNSAAKRTPAPGQKGPRGGRQAYAALDLGTNNCRLLIARPSGQDFTVIDAFSRVVRLGEGLALSGRLSDEAMDRALGALHVCAEKLRRRNVFLARSVATEACRRAVNGAQFIDRVREETGIVLDIISAQEEARLAVLGCHVLLEQGDGPALIFDIGGGSTELILVGPGEGAIPRILDWQSVPWGVVSLTDTVMGGMTPGQADDEQGRLDLYAAMRRTVDESFAPFARRIGDAPSAEDIRLLGTSGTVTTLASLHLQLPHYDRRAVDGLIVPSRSMRDISAHLSGLSLADRAKVPCIGTDRAELVVAGCAILESILDLWPAERLGVADRGIREGILRSLMSGDLDRGTRT